MKKLIISKLGKVSAETRAQKIYPAPEIAGVMWFPF